MRAVCVQVCACACYTRPSHRVVFEPLAHLLPVGRQHQAVAHQVLEGGLVKQGGRQDHEGVEPGRGEGA